MVGKIILSSVIAGIHQTGVGSHPDIKLLVENDDDVKCIDPECVMVRHPNSENRNPVIRRVNGRTISLHIRCLERRLEMCPISCVGYFVS